MLVHAALAAARRWFRDLMVNCNPETVSTVPPHRSTVLRAAHLEDVLDVRRDGEEPAGVIVQFSFFGRAGRRWKLSRALEMRAPPIIGTKPESIDVLPKIARRFQLLGKHLN